MFKWPSPPRCRQVFCREVSCRARVSLSVLAQRVVLEKKDGGGEGDVCEGQNNRKQAPTLLLSRIYAELKHKSFAIITEQNAIKGGGRRERERKKILLSNSCQCDTFALYQWIC